MNLNQWAIKWGVPIHALEDLRREMGTVSTLPEANAGGGPEARVQALIRLEASHKNIRLWRNNLGATTDDRGNFIRYGLANDSAQMNKAIKSSDLIGIRPVVITSAMVGQTIGQFVAREVKGAGWVFKATERERAQLKFIELVASLGGDAKFATGEGTL